jgi:hypothetical protein
MYINMGILELYELVKGRLCFVFYVDNEAELLVISGQLNFQFRPCGGTTLLIVSGNSRNLASY